MCLILCGWTHSWHPKSHWKWWTLNAPGHCWWFLDKSRLYHGLLGLIHVCPTMDGRRNHCCVVRFHAIKWDLVRFYKIQWDLVSYGEIHWDLIHLMRFGEIWWDMMTFCEILWDMVRLGRIWWDSMRFGEILWDLLRFREIWWDLIVNRAADRPFWTI